MSYLPILLCFLSSQQKIKKRKREDSSKVTKSCCCSTLSRSLLKNSCSSLLGTYCFAVRKLTDGSGHDNHMHILKMFSRELSEKTQVFLLNLEWRETVRKRTFRGTCPHVLENLALTLNYIS